MGVRFSLPAQNNPLYMTKPKIIIIVGPTASGKSDLAVKIAQQHNGEIISADSRQVYRGLNLGTGKITSQEMQGVTHHLLDVADPQTTFTVVEWRTQAEKAIAEIISRGKVPIIAGGTGFYISTLIDNISLPDVSANPTLRNELSSKTAEELYTLLQTQNPERAALLNISDRKNPRRLIRALEITQAGINTPKTKHESSYNPLWIGINLTIDELRSKISDRLERRLHQGMIGEVESLHKNGLSWERMEELGLEYRYIAQNLQGKISIDKMREKLAIEIGQYAKRQMTWFQKNKEIHWFDLSDYSKISDTIKEFLLAQ